jgi:hypothetical protein
MSQETAWGESSCTVAGCCVVKVLALAFIGSHGRCCVVLRKSSKAAVHGMSQETAWGESSCSAAGCRVVRVTWHLLLLLGVIGGAVQCLGNETDVKTSPKLHGENDETFELPGAALQHIEPAHTACRMSMLCCTDMLLLLCGTPALVLPTAAAAAAFDV